MLWGIVVEKCCGEVLEKCVAEKCWREVGERLCREVLDGDVFFSGFVFCGCVWLRFYFGSWAACFCFCLVEECWGEMLEKSVAEKCRREVL